jgi:hypothetical protein
MPSYFIQFHKLCQMEVVTASILNWGQGG